MRGFARVVAVASLMGAALSGCHRTPAELAADQAWVRLPAVAGNPGAAYFTLHGGEVADTLVAVSSPAALRAELHETASQGGAMRMRPVRDVAVPARGEVAFAPAGRHVMLFGLGPLVKSGGTIPLALSFAGGKRVTVQARVVGAGDPPPGD